MSNNPKENNQTIQSFPIKELGMPLTQQLTPTEKLAQTFFHSLMEQADLHIVLENGISYDENNQLAFGSLQIQKDSIIPIVLVGTLYPFENMTYHSFETNNSGNTVSDFTTLQLNTHNGFRNIICKQSGVQHDYIATNNRSVTTPTSIANRKTDGTVKEVTPEMRPDLIVVLLDITFKNRNQPEANPIKLFNVYSA